MSGNADSKQISTPIRSGRRAGPVTVSTRAPGPGSMLTRAALLIRVSQPSSPRNGMYSPNGTSRDLMYEPRIPSGPTSTATLDLPPGTSESWFTRISARSAADTRSIRRSTAGEWRRSKPTLLSPHTIRSGWRAARPSDSSRLAAARVAGLRLMPGCTSATVTNRCGTGAAVSP